MLSSLQFLDKLNQIDLDSSAKISMEETAESASNAQRDQLAQGLDKFDNFITNQETGSDTYSASYARYKGRSGPIDLRDKGDYYSGIGLEVREDIFFMFSADEKGPMLSKRYNALGLGIEAREKWIKSLRPVFMKNAFKPINF